MRSVFMSFVVVIFFLTQEMNRNLGESFYKTIFNKTNHCILQGLDFPSILKASPKFSSRFNCYNFPSHPEIKLTV